MFGAGGMAQQRSQKMQAMIQAQERFYGLQLYYRLKGWKLIGVYTDRSAGIERITVEVPTRIPRVRRKAVA